MLFRSAGEVRDRLLEGLAAAARGDLDPDAVRRAVRKRVLEELRGADTPAGRFDTLSEREVGVPSIPASVEDAVAEFESVDAARIAEMFEKYPFDPARVAESFVGPERNRDS